MNEEKLTRLQLNKMLKIIESNLSDEFKLDKLFKIMTYDMFIDKYNNLLYFAEDKSIVKKILLEYKKIESKSYILSNLRYQDDINKVLINNNYIENYEYAKFVIKTYINDDESYLKSKLLNNLSISNQTFEYCVKLIKFIDPLLYKIYEEKVNKNNKEKSIMIKKTIDEIVEGIKTNYLSNGKLFDNLEFYKLVPFKESEYNFVKDLNNFIINYYGYYSDTWLTINYYLYQNNILKIKYVDEEMINRKKIIKNKVLITPHIVNIIFRYMKVNDLPNIDKVYDIVLAKYLKNDIDMADLIKKEHDLKNSSKYNNPYVLKSVNQKRLT